MVKSGTIRLTSVQHAENEGRALLFFSHLEQAVEAGSISDITDRYTNRYYTQLYCRLTRGRPVKEDYIWSKETFFFFEISFVWHELCTEGTVGGYFVEISEEGDAGYRVA